MRTSAPGWASLAAETTDSDLTASPALLAEALDFIDSAATRFEHARVLTESYIADHSTEVPSIADIAVGRHDRDGGVELAGCSDIPSDSSPPSGRWDGRTATEYAQTAGEGIGRKAHGSKKIPTREVRTAEEITDIFIALARGGTRLDIPGYKGTMVRLPDGSTVGYRTQSRSSTEPTVDIATALDAFLKIHVNPEKWG
ncbi:hypothetical protein FHR81_002432 [Actinoalloteichus hoggarensis]|uniref:Uncharacterized protein n=1 Tax=Actinoalloteichus hoggarensis TaxID=1470176 RepID=A0A221VX11_9PSEU|nr:hypothetical protein [Actinoalloteichus hoggarensis]ASO18038.1 hypothetical protein AHOG_01870 [Actinoalloteichus hoggarensis]MBB5921392.1 hypothetical protein [Actinoalloteichus hoggarensis]